jgi:nucleotide-binding universal stress UspA family protein
MNRILVGIDGSEGSERALIKALTVIDDYGELILLAVITSPDDGLLDNDEIHIILKEKAEKLLSNIIKDIKHHNFTVKGIIEQGDPSAKIIDIANKLEVDLIVLGSKGTSKLGQYLIGSVTNKVVQYAHKPVMVVR